jgi:hypothetical protein
MWDWREKPSGYTKPTRGLVVGLAGSQKAPVGARWESLEAARAGLGEDGTKETEMFASTVLTAHFILAVSFVHEDRLLDSETFWQVFDQSPSFTVIQTMSKEEQKLYFPLQRKEVEEACRDFLWRATDEFYYDACRIFVAATPFPELQAKFAARLVGLSPYWMAAWLFYYDHDEERFIEWVLKVEREFGRYTDGGKNSAWCYGAFLFDIWSVYDSMPIATERAFWSLLRHEKVDKEELPDMRRDLELAREFWRRVSDMSLPRDFWSVFAVDMPRQVVDSLFTRYAEKKGLWNTSLDDRIYFETWSAPIPFSSSPEAFYRDLCGRHYEEVWKTDIDKILTEIEEGRWGKLEARKLDGGNNKSNGLRTEPK